VDLDDATCGGLRAPTLQDARVGWGQRSPAEGELGQGIEAVESLEDAVGGNRAHQLGQDRRVADVLAQPEGGLMESDNRYEPGEREPEDSTEDGAPSAVQDPEAPPEGQEAPRALGECGARRAQQRGAHDGARQTRERDPTGVVRKELWRDPRACERADAEPHERERLGDETAVRALHGEDRDPEDEENVGDAHGERTLRRAPDLAATYTTRLTSRPGTTIAFLTSFPSRWL
jgi:hypothetical protein